MAEIKKYAFLYDATRCVDCRACMVACSVENNVPMDETRIWLQDMGVKGEYPNLQRATVPYHCMHCEKPACASACPVGAYTKRADGPVVYDSSKCIGCRYCMNACPFGVPHFQWDQGLLEAPIIVKCTMCEHRLAEGRVPACVQTCLSGALAFGEREEMLAEARSRMAAHPGRYVDHIYGEHENGGTSYLMIAHVPFEQIGMPQVPPQPVETNSESVMHITIPFALGWTAVLSGVAGLVRLRERRMSANANAKADAEPEPEPEAAEKEESR